jgi:hypothetical protein
VFSLRKTLDIKSNPDTEPLYILPPLHFTHKSLGKEISYATSEGISWQNAIPASHHQPTCGDTNVPLSIRIKYDAAPCHFVSTGYTDNSLEYLGVQTPYTNNSAFTTKTYSGKKPFIATRRGVGLLLRQQWCKW